ncbi:RidA family protein [Ottowia thiooxydans]|uniref:RidA family protein n=1 Tax=Ottowia thiooxydans TaxID=219182 RepID=UPI00040A6E8D|nr:RidA family protein [Ottowia thiooxydans]
MPDTPRFSPVNVVSVGEATMLFVSGITAGTAAPYDTEAQTQIVFDKIRALLQSHGADCHDIRKITVFLTDIREYAQFSQVRNQVFADMELPPASSAVEARLGSPSVRVEIEAIAVRRNV